MESIVQRALLTELFAVLEAGLKTRWGGEGRISAEDLINDQVHDEQLRGQLHRARGVRNRIAHRTGKPPTTQEIERSISDVRHGLAAFHISIPSDLLTPQERAQIAARGAARRAATATPTATPTVAPTATHTATLTPPASQTTSRLPRASSGLDWRGWPMAVPPVLAVAGYAYVGGSLLYSIQHPADGKAVAFGLAIMFVFIALIAFVAAAVMLAAVLRPTLGQRLLAAVLALGTTAMYYTSPEIPASYKPLVIAGGCAVIAGLVLRRARAGR